MVNMTKVSVPILFHFARKGLTVMDRPPKLEVMKARKTPITMLLDQIEDMLAMRGATIADLAREIGRNYHQVYKWVHLREFNPSATGLMLLQDWRDTEISRARRVSARVASMRGTQE
jgi:hypothetical protein